MPTEDAAPDGACDLLFDRGGPVFPNQVTQALREALGIDSETVPDGAVTALRTTPDIFGFGLLDAVPDSALLAIADPEETGRLDDGGQHDFELGRNTDKVAGTLRVPSAAGGTRGLPATLGSCWRN